jgi:hypothetical protein
LIVERGKRFDERDTFRVDVLPDLLAPHLTLLSRSV